MCKATIFDIERNSFVDGPGIRTAIFFKGCNLDCFWCHNPEGKSPLAELAVFKNRCAGCGACRKKCEKDVCTVCGECTAVCPENARRIYGREYTVSELIEIINSDKLYYSSTGGGVTFSGGECMLYPDYISELAERCKSCGISVAVDTAGCVPYESFCRVLPYTDVFLYDIKAIDPELHRNGTGKSNVLILENLDRLVALGKKIIIRVPVIPGFNDGEELIRIQEYCRTRSLEYELLPYHEFGIDKKAALTAVKIKHKNNE